MKAPANSPKLLALSRLIGATPLLEIHCRYRGREQRIYAKHEAYNFTGSIKDRMALYILQRAYESGEIAPGDVIAEATAAIRGSRSRPSAARSGTRYASTCRTGCRANACWSSRASAPR